MSAEELQEQLAKAEVTVRALQEELAETNRGLVALTLELEQRVEERTRELRRLNQELEARVQERTAQMRQANENLQSFAHTAAHDLRSPLRAIKSFSSIVLEDYSSQIESEGRAMLERIVQSAGQMQRLLDDLLEYSRLGEAGFKLEEVSLQDAVRDSLALLEADIRAKQAVVTVAGPLPKVIGHSATIVTLLNNLVSNALKFVAPGVQPGVRVWAESVQGPKSSVQSQEPAATEHATGATSPPVQYQPTTIHYIRLWVEDNGIGISAEDVPKLFKVFQRLHGKQAYPGTGLGLAIVRRGAERMGGQVGMESAPGQGSRFWVELPSASSEAESSGQKRA